MRILPVVKVGPKLYFMDERLRQYRSLVPYPEIIEFIDFGQEPWDKVEWICYHHSFTPDASCPDCHFTEVSANGEIEDGKDDIEPAPKDGGCMYDHDHRAHPEQCEWHE